MQGHLSNTEASRGLVQLCEPPLHHFLHLNIEPRDVRSEAIVHKRREKFLRRLRVHLSGTY